MLQLIKLDQFLLKLHYLQTKIAFDKNSMKRLHLNTKFDLTKSLTINKFQDEFDKDLFSAISKRELSLKIWVVKNEKE